MWSGGTAAALPGGFVDAAWYPEAARWRDGGMLAQKPFPPAVCQRFSEHS